MRRPHGSPWGGEAPGEIGADTVRVNCFNDFVKKLGFDPACSRMSQRVTANPICSEQGAQYQTALMLADRQQASTSF
jgi:hypothetical protein